MNIAPRDRPDFGTLVEIWLAAGPPQATGQIAALEIPTPQATGQIAALEFPTPQATGQIQGLAGNESLTPKQ